MKEGQSLRFAPPPLSMTRTEFIEKFGGVYEHFPEIAGRAWDGGLGPASDTPAGLAASFAAAAAGLDRNAQLKLIRNHPDLAGRLGIGVLTQASQSEQTGAGLDQCSPKEFARFTVMNKLYKEKFKFPFILAVAGRNRAEILAAFETRIENDRGTEFQTALAEIDKIARIRLERLAT